MEQYDTPVVVLDRGMPLRNFDAGGDSNKVSLLPYTMCSQFKTSTRKSVNVCPIPYDTYQQLKTHRFSVFIGSCWHVQLRPGGHDTLPAKPIDVSAFSYSKRTAHQSPLSFLKRGTGNGGTVIPFGSGEESSSSGGATKGGGGTRASARAAALKKTKLRDFQVRQTEDRSIVSPRSTTTAAE